MKSQTQQAVGRDISHERAAELHGEDFVNEDHIAAFAEALGLNDLAPETGDSTPISPRSPKQPTSKFASTSRRSSGIFGNSTPDGDASISRKSGGPLSPAASMRSNRQGAQVEKVQALSDFAPIHQRVSSRRKPVALRQGWSFHLARWPLLGLIFIVIFCEFGMYVLTRQIVNGWEWLVALLGRGHKRTLRRKLRAAKTWEEWKKAALEMDDYLGFNEWKETDEDPNYDYPLVRKVRRNLIDLRSKGDVRGLMGVLEICLRSNFAGTESTRIYSETFYGTKRLIESYVEEIKASLDFVRESDTISLEEKKRFYRAVNKNYGSSALCLSGGASFGYYHFGVVKAFLDADLLPRVITGTSAGGLVAALTCTRTDEELRELMTPQLADHLTACEEDFTVWMTRFIKTGARFDTVMWARKSAFWTRGSLTFREAYERTGRALNISVIPHDRHSPTKLLNYLTAPDCVIWSAIIASAAVPGILNSVVLMQKMKDGSLRPMNWGSKFKDGSLRVDIPLQSLHLLFNVNHSIVSQVNPHVHLFFFAPRGAVGRPVAHRKGWRGGFLLSAAEQYLKLELTKNFKVIRDLELLPTMLGQDWSSVFLQKFEGSVTIWPRTRLWDWFRLLTDPDRAELARMLRVGQLVTWPKLHMIDNRLKIERAVLRGRYEVRQAMHNNRTTTDGVSAATSVHSVSRQQIHIPLESDVERGFAARAKSHKRPTATNANASKINAAASHGETRASPVSEKNAMRRRRIGQVASPPAEDSTDSAARHRIDYARDLLESPDEHAPPSAPRSPPSGYSTLGSSFSRLRTRSVPGVPSESNFFSFRQQGGRLDTHVEQQNEAPKEPRQHRESTTSRLSRWFNPNTIDSDSSTSDEFVLEDTEPVHPSDGGMQDQNGGNPPDTGSLSEDELSDTEEDGDIGVDGEPIPPNAGERGAAEGAPPEGSGETT